MPNKSIGEMPNNNILLNKLSDKLNRDILHEIKQFGGKRTIKRKNSNKTNKSKKSNKTNKSKKSKKSKKSRKSRKSKKTYN